MRDRHYAAYRGSPDEQTADDYNAGDRKNRMATIGVLLGPNDHQFPNAMCMRITISGEAGQASKWSTEWVAYDENRGDYSSATWTYPSGHSGSSLNVLHHHWDIGVYGGASWADLNVRRFNISIEIPLDLVQDSESGLYLAEPMGSGKYNISGSLSLTRHSVDTFHGYRDAYTDLALRFIATLASRQIKFLFMMCVSRKCRLARTTCPRLKSSGFADGTALGRPQLITTWKDIPYCRKAL